MFKFLGIANRYWAAISPKDKPAIAWALASSCASLCGDEVFIALSSVTYLSLLSPANLQQASEKNQYLFASSARLWKNQDN